MPRTLLVAPAARQVGLTTVSLGLVRAFDRQGVRVAYAKPFAVPGQTTSTALVKLGSTLQPPEPIARQKAEELLAAGDDQTLMEQVVALCNKAGEGADVLVVEGMVPLAGGVYATRVNQLMLKALDAELVLVGAPGNQTPFEAASSIAIASRGFGADDARSVSCVLNFVPDDDAKLDRWRAALADEKLHAIAVIPGQEDLLWPRVKDVGAALGARAVHAGEQELRRVRDVRLIAMTVPNSLRAFGPGALLVTPGDRDDVIMAASLVTLGGVQLAGLVLTGGITPSTRVMELCAPAFATGLPVLAVDDNSMETAKKLSEMDKRIAVDDKDRVERAMTTIADRIDGAWLRSIVETKRQKRLSPPAFRHRLIEAARAANKRIVLPEGDEPRTIAAAVIVQERGIARCALLGKPEQIHAVAEKQGVKLPASVEIIDPASVASRYVEPLLERRRAKGMTTDIAQSELQDTIMIGTMMMALGEADGLVSGAVHTTAHTIRPALQLIKTAPGCNLVSSVFFMCLPDQVLVFGDCAVNPNPTAEQLADIAIQSADSAAAFGIPPRVAMLSYSTGTSGGGEDVEKVKKATDLAKAQRPDLLIDGPLQYDAAVMPDVGRSKAPKSPVAGKATVLIFPDLNTGNVTYKAVQRSANVVSMGPMLQGLAKPVNDLSRGCLVEDIVFTIVLTAIQAEQAAARKKS